ncbi:MAG: hypothetical protein HGB14_01070 [Anaerolineaceae bacterium]|nr:hypothetical protein [Anaerolineaceae bacterium]
MKKILTLHPQGKHGVNIDQEKYDLIKSSIIEILKTNKEISFGEMIQIIESSLAGKFDGSISWYVVSVKLDLEARGIIRRIPKSSPQIITLSEEGMD